MSEQNMMDTVLLGLFRSSLLDCLKTPENFEVEGCLRYPYAKGTRGSARWVGMIPSTAPGRHESTDKLSPETFIFRRRGI